jgi:hypothetical protein
LHTCITKFHNLKSLFIDTLDSWFWTIHARCSSMESSSDVFTNDHKALKVSKLFICAPSTLSLKKKVSKLQPTWLLFLYQENSYFNACYGVSRSLFVCP